MDGLVQDSGRGASERWGGRRNGLDTQGRVCTANSRSTITRTLLHQVDKIEEKEK